MLHKSDRTLGRWVKPAAALAAVFALLAPMPASAEIGSYIVVDIDTDEVIAAKDPFQPWHPASLTKMMTAYVVFKEIEAGRITFTSPVTITPHARSQPPSKMGFRVGSELTIKAALTIILTKSANDVTAAIAEAVGGTERNFVRKMNEVAAALGMAQTNYANPHGLPNPRQITSARDLAILVNALKEDFPQYADMFKLSGFKLGKRVYRNHNRLLTRYPGTNGMKTGFICSSGFNLAASAERDGHHLAAIVLGGYNGRERNERTAEYLEMAFRELAARDAGTPHGENLYRMVSPLPANTPPVDLRPIICGATKARTVYDDGTVSEAEHRAARAALRRVRARQRDVVEAALAEGSVPAADPARVAHRRAARRAIVRADQVIAANMGIATPSLGSAVTAYAPTSGGPVLPPRRPITMAATLAEAEAAAMPGPDLAEAVLKPVSYLSWNRGIGDPVTISLGGADEARPNPLSGTVVGGGRAPLPRPRPILETLVASAATVAPEADTDAAAPQADAPEAAAPPAGREADPGKATPMAVTRTAATKRARAADIPDDAEPTVELGAPDVVDEGSGEAAPAPTETFAAIDGPDRTPKAAAVEGRDRRPAARPPAADATEAPALRAGDANPLAEKLAPAPGRESPPAVAAETAATETSVAAGRARPPVLYAAPDCLAGPAAAAVSGLKAASFLPAEPTRAAPRNAKPDDLPALDPDKPVFARHSGGVPLPAKRPPAPVPLARPAAGEDAITVAAASG